MVDGPRASGSVKSLGSAILVIGKPEYQAGGYEVFRVIFLQPRGY